MYSTQESILICEDGTARLRDPGIMCVVTHAAGEPGSMTMFNPGAVRYAVPGPFDQSRLNLLNIKPTKESDDYFLAVTAYEVGSSHAAHCHL